MFVLTFLNTRYLLGMCSLQVRTCSFIYWSVCFPSVQQELLFYARLCKKWAAGRSGKKNKNKKTGKDGWGKTGSSNKKTKLIKERKNKHKNIPRHKSDRRTSDQRLTGSTQTDEVEKEGRKGAGREERKQAQVTGEGRLGGWGMQMLLYTY